MPFIAENHFQFILEIAVIIFATIIFTINLVPISLSVVTFLSLFLSVGFTFLFGADLLMLFLAFGQNEFTHPFGPIALLAIITALASLKVMEDSGVNVVGLKKLVFALLLGITVFGGLMHRSFLLLWIIGLFIGYFLISKSFRQKSYLTIKRILMFLGIGAAGFFILELLSQLLHMDIFSPLLRIGRLEENSLPSLKMVLKNTQLVGHVQGSAFWGAQDTGFASGYISLPMGFIIMFGLPFPLFFGLLVTKKDMIDYMLPGIFGYAFDFGYLGLLGLVLISLITIVVGLKMLRVYRSKREKNNKNYLGREVLLIGSLTAFMAQALIGLFIFNRSINGTALLTFIILSALVIAHIVSLKRN
ncbi:hypothetical protein MBCUT_04300 [Methanobrevibacter cuticularis]|uniref:Uncharacterized protein n=1 Tax=Methanobrevibacter cuticularis TaxID=47311 RepID=A0A166EUI3_9EURY|nr:hypothetical protein [Methanobrevibacter cuticularis]KZX17024.1 hypothetical protein MBCUT_04300 [Methanobrevibacter cuticularis]